MSRGIGECMRWWVLALALSGCGYRFAAGPSRLPEGVRALWAPVFLNKTAEPGVEALFTQSFREQLIRSGVDGDEKAEARVEGEIQSIFGAGTLVTPTGGLASYRLTATATLKLVKEGRVLAEATVTGSEDYLPGSDVLEAEANRMAALRRLSDAMMRDGYERLMRGW